MVTQISRFAGGLAGGARLKNMWVKEREAHLVEDDGLADGAPGHGEGAHEQNEEEQHADDDGDTCVDRLDQETHDEAAYQTQQRRVPAEPPERRSTKQNHPRQVKTINISFVDSEKIAFSPSGSGGKSKEKLCFPFPSQT